MPKPRTVRIRHALASTLLVLTGLYVAFGLFAVAALFWHPGDDPLAGVFLVIAALPWTPLLGHWLDLLGEPRPLWLTAAVLAVGVAANIFILVGIARLLRGPK